MKTTLENEQHKHPILSISSTECDSPRRALPRYPSPSASINPLHLLSESSPSPGSGGLFAMTKRLMHLRRLLKMRAAPEVCIHAKVAKQTLTAVEKPPASSVSLRCSMNEPSSDLLDQTAVMERSTGNTHKELQRINSCTFTPTLQALHGACGQEGAGTLWGQGQAGDDAPGIRHCLREKPHPKRESGTPRRPESDRNPGHLEARLRKFI